VTIAGFLGPTELILGLFPLILQKDFFMFSALQHPIPKFNKIKGYRADFKKVAGNRYKKYNFHLKVIIKLP